MKAKCHNLMDTPKQIIANDNRYITTTYSIFPGIEFSFVDVHGHRIIEEKKISYRNMDSYLKTAL